MMTDQTDVAAELAALKAANAELRERIAKLEDRGRPSAPIKSTPMPLRDLTERASMPPSALRAMSEAVPSVVIREIANGDRVPAQLAPLARGYPTPVAQQNRSGVRNAAPLTNPPGVALADKLMDVQDARERAELIEREAKRLAQR